MTRFTNTDGSRTIELHMKWWNGSSFSQESSEDIISLSEHGALFLADRDRVLDAYVVDDVEDVLDLARAWLNYSGEFEPVSDDEREEELHSLGERWMDHDDSDDTPRTIAQAFIDRCLNGSTPDSLRYAVLDSFNGDTQEDEELFTDLDEALAAFEAQWSRLSDYDRKHHTLNLAVCVIDEDGLIDYGVGYDRLRSY